ncbi:hybrid sensor histidine kinase/response regulator [Aeoliella mucimassa]|uniref:histidine kinase n=1 Tax=Aeoliella mucimassa TaxID=2527972 RepID=A0A518ATI2_9BACT|nr:chemotaxis protein CheW [Aeoliella mucimassa]QDU58015.1 Chemotaxis protein CheA [Aeoliella mucimassa]
MTIEDEELVGEFVVESNEHLADIENQLLQIEQAGANIDADLVNKVFRGIHSIKGAAGFLGFTAIKELAHSLENVLNKIRSNELVPDSNNTNVMLRAGDTLRVLINDAANSNNVDVSEQINHLNQVLDGNAVGAAPAAEVPVEQLEVAEAPVVEEPATVTEVAEVEVVDSPEVVEEYTPTPEQSYEPEPVPAAPVSYTPPAPTSTIDTGAANKTTVTPVDSSIRVSVNVLDHLMNLAGELVLSRNQLMQAVASQERMGLDAAAADLDQVTSSLQEAIMQTRMQPIGTVFGKFPRIVRDLSGQLGKQCKIEIEGKEVEVDKTIVEAIGDPLTHLIRNSVDHGVETPEVRSRNRKPVEGSIWLRAFHKAGKVCIEIQDDGAGIDPAKLRKKAMEKGVISADRAEAMSDREAVRLIFHPGFSTAEKVSDVSGRGVGMDVVRTNIEKLGGAVDVDSEVGVGTNIRVTLPLTLAIIPSMIVKCGRDQFALPQANIAELVRLRPGEVASRIDRVKSAEVLRLRGALLPLVRLDESLGLPRNKSENSNAPMNIIVVETGQVRYGLIVDGIHDSEEIVVKPLGMHLKGENCLAGATILGNGRVALILDAAGIASKSGVQLTHDSNEAHEAHKESVEQNHTQTLLLFSSDPADLFAVPMGVVARIERVKTANIDRVGGQELLQYRGTSLPLISVESQLKVNARPDVDRLYVIVFTIGEREVGLVAPKLDDIRELSCDIDDETFKEPGVAGSLVIDDRVTRLLDVFELAEVTHPQWFTESREDVSEPEDNPPRILLAEDSSFFRRQVAGFFKNEGFETYEYEDGLEAWNALSQDGVEVDLVVTDIEMPNMDGFQLCQNIRNTGSLQHLPTIALTSLSSESDVMHGQQVGFNDYQVKMHRENLIRSIRNLLAASKGGKKNKPRRKLATAGS